MSLRVEIAEAVTEELNATEFSLPFIAARYRVLSWTPEDLAELRVAVFPSSYASQHASRRHTERRVTVEIAVQKHLRSVDSAAVDPLADLAEEIASHFEAFPRLAGCCKAVLDTVENDPPYYMAHLNQKSVFTSVITLTFRVLEG